jgi:hypothetical protein
MTNQPQPAPIVFAEPQPGPTTLNIETFSYEERGVIFPAITHALDTCGCWLQDRRPLSFTQIEFHFELHLGSVVDLYAALIAAGLELTRASHEEFTMLCTLRKHKDSAISLPGVVTVRLEVSFIEEGSAQPALSPGTTHS